MARRRHREANNSTRKHRALSQEQHNANIRFLNRHGKNPADPTNARSVARQAREIRQREALERHYTREVSDKQLRDDLKAHGFQTNKRGVVIDGPRDSRRKPIKGAKFSTLKGGVVKWKVGERADYIVGFTAKEKKDFAQNPELVIQQVMKRLRERAPTLRKVKPSRIQRRLQWGAFQASKDFSPSYFTKEYFAMVSPEDASRGRRQKRLDKLTGLHFVVHTPSKKKRGKSGKKGKRK